MNYLHIQSLGKVNIYLFIAPKAQIALILSFSPTPSPAKTHPSNTLTWFSHHRAG